MSDDMSEFEAELEDVKTPDVLGKLTGYRMFHTQGDKLMSYSRDYEWTVGPNQAFCPNGGYTEDVWVNNADGTDLIRKRISKHGSIPSPECQCGFWIYKDIETLEAKMFGPGMFNSFAQPRRRRGSATNSFGVFDSPDDVGMLVGQVRLWGRIIEGSDGFRAEWAEVSQLYGGGFAKRIAERYGVPLVAPPPSENSVEGLIQVHARDKRAPTGNLPPASVFVYEDQDDPNNPKAPKELLVWQEERRAKRDKDGNRVRPPNSLFLQLLAAEANEHKVRVEFRRGDHPVMGTQTWVEGVFDVDDESSEEE